MIDHDGSGNAFGVLFPDLPGCFSAGATLDEAMINAHEALELHLEVMAEEGLNIPVPSILSEVEVPDGVREVARFLVPGTTADKVERINISLDRGLLARIDVAAKARGMSRSAFLAQAARDKIRSA